MTNYRLLIHHIAQLVTVCDSKELYKAGKDQNEISLMKDVAIVVDMEGRISAIGPSDDILEQYKEECFKEIIDATGYSIIPGFCDAHTHMLWAGDRVHEFEMKLAGATYMDIHKAGGGIGFTVDHVRRASEEDLLKHLMLRLDRIFRYGTTLVEAKSGYGLETEAEMKMLRVLAKANAQHPIDIVSTYCGAHSVPKDTDAETYTQQVINEQIPLLVKQRDEGLMEPSMIDVFFEEGIFNAEQTTRILEAGKAVGLEANFHGDELHSVHAGELAGELGALAVSHCEQVTEEGIVAMSKRPSIAVLLPNTAYVLRLVPPPARDMITGSVPVALGSDLNPNAHCTSMPHIMNQACVTMKMTMKEALVAATINGAASMDKARDYGSIEVGKWANMVVLQTPSWEHVIYQMADPPIIQTIIKGIVFNHTL